MSVLIQSKYKFPKTLQGVFNRAWAWANRPEFKKCQPENADGVKGCLYRNEDNTNCCLIGACIPDNMYEKRIETWGVTRIITMLKIELDFPSVTLYDLQQCHDKSASREDCIDRLKSFACDHELKIPAVK